MGPAGTLDLPEAVEVKDSRLLPALQVLLDGSPRVRAALDALPARARIRIYTFDSAPHDQLFQARYAYAYTHARTDWRGRVTAADVALDWRRLHSDGRALQVMASQLRLEKAVLLGHELFGHAVPLLDAGTRDGECRDVLPTGGSCSVPRENEIRTDLGVAPRTDYRLIDLSVTRLHDGIGPPADGSTF